MEVDALLLDVGGTLYQNKDFDKQFSTVLDDYLATQLKIDRPAAKEILRDRMAQFERSEGDPSKVRAMASFGVDRAKVHELFAQVDPSDYLGPEETTMETLTLLAQRGVRMAVLSNFRSAVIERVLRQIGVVPDLFEFMITEDDGLPIKPSPAPFEAALERFGLPASRVGYVGDSLSKDIRPANKVGYITFWVNAEDKTDGHATHTIADISGLLTLV